VELGASGGRLAGGSGGSDAAERVFGATRERRLVRRFVEHYSNVRSQTWQSQLHSSIGYVAPRHKLERREEAISAERDHKLEKARQRRRVNRQRDRPGKAECPTSGWDVLE